MLTGIVSDILLFISIASVYFAEFFIYALPLFFFSIITFTLIKFSYKKLYSALRFLIAFCREKSLKPFIALFREKGVRKKIIHSTMKSSIIRVKETNSNWRAKRSATKAIKKTYHSYVKKLVTEMDLSLLNREKVEDPSAGIIENYNHALEAITSHFFAGDDIFTGNFKGKVMILSKSKVTSNSNIHVFQ